MSSDAPIHDHRTPSDVLADARRMGRVIRCVYADGSESQFVSVGSVLPDKFVRVDLCAATCEQTPGVIVGRDAVLNAIRTCQPDVQLVKEQDSVFGGDDDG